MAGKKEASAQAKGRMRVAAKEQEAAREKKINALRASGYNSSKVQDPKTKKFRNTDGATGIAPAQYGNPKPNARNAARNAAFGSGKKLARGGK